MKIDGVEVIEGDMINLVNHPNIIGKKLWYLLFKSKKLNQNGIYKVTKIGTNAN
jgi:hypothetical protein